MSKLFLLLLFAGATLALFDFAVPELPSELDGIEGGKLSDPENVDCGHHHRRHRCHHHFPPPPFLKKVNRHARREFYRIVKNKDTTGVEKARQLDEWAKKQGGDILKELHAYEEKVKKFAEKIHNGMVATVQAIPAAYDKVSKILGDPNLTPREIWVKLVELKLDPVVARSLRAVYFFVVHQRKAGMQEFKITPSLGLGHVQLENFDDDTNDTVIQPDFSE